MKENLLGWGERTIVTVIPFVLEVTQDSYYDPFG